MLMFDDGVDQDLRNIPELEQVSTYPGMQFLDLLVQ